MQEDIENRTVSMAVSGSKFTGRMLKDAITKLLAHQKNPKVAKDVTPHGKQTVRQLAAQNQGMTSIEIKDKSIKDFERIARKYGVDFAVKKVKGEDPKFYVFFKAKDADALTAAFEEYTKKRVHDKSKPSVIKTLRSLQAMIAAKQIDPVKSKKQERSLSTLLDDKTYSEYIAHPYRGVDVRIPLYRDVNVIFGQKGTGKSEILKSLIAALKNQGVKCEEYIGGDREKQFGEFLKTNDMSRIVSKLGIDECFDEFAFIAKYREHMPTLFGDYLDWYATKDNTLAFCSNRKAAVHLKVSFQAIAA